MSLSPAHNDATWKDAALLTKMMSSMHNVYVVGSVGSAGTQIVRIVHIADTHGCHYDLLPDIPMGHILIHSGNFADYRWKRHTFNKKVERERQLTRMYHFFNRLPHPYKIFVAGNEDCLLESMTPAEIQQRLPPNVIYLHNASCTVLGLRIYGSPWNVPQSRFFARGFARNENVICKLWSQIPADTDILVTHMAPWGREKFFNEVVQRIKPVVHVFSDAHAGPGIRWKNRVLFSNGSLNGRYASRSKQLASLKDVNSLQHLKSKTQAKPSKRFLRSFASRPPSGSLCTYTHLHADLTKGITNPITIDVYSLSKEEDQLPDYSCPKSSNRRHDLTKCSREGDPISPRKHKPLSLVSTLFPSKRTEGQSRDSDTSIRSSEVSNKSQSPHADVDIQCSQERPLIGDH